MKKWLKIELTILTLIVLLSSIGSCNEKTETKKEVSKETKEQTLPKKKKLTSDFKKYWYASNAEITSYQLQMARYGEEREGKSVLIFVTEPFLADKQVKADGKNPDNISVLKLNSTKKFLTGIYPYSIMTSSFYPVYDNQHAIKVSTSVQEWCGHVYAQLNNREQYEFTSHSYFESDADQTFTIEKAVLEDELWAKIRIDPKGLPLGNFNAIPSFEFLRMSHKEFKSYEAVASVHTENRISTYEVNYPELNRTLKIDFTDSFPYTIEGWTETSKSGFGSNERTMQSSATKINSLRTPYWSQNSNKFLYLRDSLGI